MSLSRRSIISVALLAAPLLTLGAQKAEIKREYLNAMGYEQ